MALGAGELELTMVVLQVSHLGGQGPPGMASGQTDLYSISKGGNPLELLLSPCVVAIKSLPSNGLGELGVPSLEKGRIQELLRTPSNG